MTGLAPKTDATKEPATIKLHLVHGTARELRTAEVMNWSIRAIAAPRTQLEELVAREELNGVGVYILTGHDLDSGEPVAYIGEGEGLRARIRKHRSKDFWVQAFVFVSKDDNLTKGHVRYLEGRLIAEVQAGGRAKLENQQRSGARLPESDRHDMEVFLSKIRQLLPVLGSDLLVPHARQQVDKIHSRRLICTIKGLSAHGERTPEGFVVFSGSQAVLELRKFAKGSGNFAERRRAELLETGILVVDGDALRFTDDVEFSSPSAAATVVRGGNSSGLTTWRDDAGRTLKELEDN